MPVRADVRSGRGLYCNVSESDSILHLKAYNYAGPELQGCVTKFTTSRNTETMVSASSQARISARHGYRDHVLRPWLVRMGF